MTGEKTSKKNNRQIKPNNMKGKIKAIRMIYGMLREKNTGIILCRDSKETLVIIRGKAGDIAKNIATAMAKDEVFRTVITASVLVNKLEEGSGPTLNESGLAELRKILEKTIAEGGAR